MKENKAQKQLALGKMNLILLSVGVLIIFAGFALMYGSPSGLEYNPDIFSFRRITVAPTVSLTGFLFVIVAILWKEKPKKEDEE
ncbi:MAG: DUF3098 domain-containing protein [Prevotellaceae bacterium]|jgi:uncharacterized membrane protein|nr:DUF3098 domain-containing protein [Prevotellaceae bacterium]